MPADDALRCQEGQLLDWRGVTFFADTPQKHFISRLCGKSQMKQKEKHNETRHRRITRQSEEDR